MSAKRERYTPHDVGPSPLDWTAPYLQEVSTLITNGFVGTATPYYTDNKGVPYLYGTNVRANKIDPTGIRYISEEFHEKQSKTKLKKGDLLTVQSGHIGETAVVIDEFDGANCHALIVTRTISEYVYPDYLSYYINSEIGKARLKGLEVGSTILHINTKDLKKFRVLLPPLPEQRKIAKILSTWDKAISTTERLIDNSKQQKKALMQQLLTGKKRLLDDSGRVFEGEWEELKLEQLAKYRRGSFPQPYGNPEWVDEINGYPFIQVYDIDKNMRLKSDTKIKISDAAIGKSVFIPKGSIIVSLQGSIGRVAITQYDAYVDRTVLLFQQFLVPMNKVFFAYTIQELFEIEKTKAPGGTIKTITKEVLSSFKVRIPSFEEQTKIASVLTNADKEINLLEQQLADLKQEKQALMQQLLTGKRRVKVDTEDAA